MPQNLSFCINRCTALLVFFGHTELEKYSILTSSQMGQEVQDAELKSFDRSDVAQDIQLWALLQFHDGNQSQRCNRQHPGLAGCPPNPSASCCLAPHYQKHPLHIEWREFGTWEEHQQNASTWHEPLWELQGAHVSAQDASTPKRGANPPHVLAFKPNFYSKSNHGSTSGRAKCPKWRAAHNTAAFPVPSRSPQLQGGWRCSQLGWGGWLLVSTGVQQGAQAAKQKRTSPGGMYLISPNPEKLTANTQHLKKQTTGHKETKGMRGCPPLNRDKHPAAQTRDFSMSGEKKEKGKKKNAWRLQTTQPPAGLNSTQSTFDFRFK